MKKLTALFMFFMLAISTQVFAQEGMISGTVTDVSGGEPLPGVNVVVEGTTRGVVTDFDGKYSIKASVGEVLMFSSVGMKTQSITVGENNTINVKMTEDAQALKQVIVTALGIKRTRKSLTYSAQDVKADELTRVKDVNPINSLSGKISGITINRSASGTGGSVKVTIRGNSSFRNNQPLYVVDGIPISNVSSAQGNSVFGGNGEGNRDGGDAVSLINPDDIESITVLKGASASALYGSQGANGVILVTTKKGRSGSAIVKVASNVTFDKVVDLPRFQTEYTASSGAETSWDGLKKKFSEHVNGFFETGVTIINSVSLSAGTSKAQTFFSYANTNAGGVIPTNKLLKHNLNVRETASFFNDKLDVDATISLTDQNIVNKPTSGLYYNTLTGLYLFPRGNNFETYKNDFEIFDPNRNLMAQNWLTDSHIEQNPYWILNRNKTTDHNQRVLAKASFTYKAGDNLKFKTHLSYDKLFNVYERKVYATTQGTLSHRNGRYIKITDDNIQLYASLMAVYHKNLTDDVELTTNLGTSITNSRFGDKLTLDSGVAPGLKLSNWFTIANFNGTNNISQSIDSKRELQSIYGSVQLGYREMLYADLTARNDWSSTLVNTDNMSFFYPSFGLTGILTKMLDMSDNISFAKVRASYSKVGNDIPAFVTSPRNSIHAGNVSGPITGPKPGTSLKPEIQTAIEFGTEWKFFDSRLGFDFTYYKSNTENQYIVIGAPATNPFGYQNYAFNAASVENKGFEISLYGYPIKTDKFSWNSILNYAKNKNMVSGIPDDLNGRLILTDPGVNGYQLVIENNKPFGIIEGKKLIRDANGNILLNTSGELQKGEFEDVGCVTPDFTLGWTNSVDYGNFSLNIHIDGRFGGQVMSVTEAMLDGFGVSERTAEARNAGGVNIDGLTDFNAKEYYTTIGNRAGALGEYIYDATNIRLKELSLGYKFSFNNGFMIRRANVSLVGRNLMFLYKKAPYDPNISLSTGEGLQGVDVFGMPSTRSIGFNVNLTF